ncbi:MAG: transglutaminaseTgpA domain-containing protein [bacterium]|nr:transglutaminaseTgpA domain-containing protein [bacterium]
MKAKENILNFNEQNLTILYFITLTGFLISAYCTFKYLHRINEFVGVGILSIIFAIFSNELRRWKRAGFIIDNIIGIVFIFVIYKNLKMLGTEAFYLKDVLAISMVWGGAIFSLSLTKLHRFKTMGIISLILIIYSASIATDLYILLEIFAFLIFFLLQLMILSNADIKNLDGYQAVDRTFDLIKRFLPKVILLDGILFIFAVIAYISVPQFWNESLRLPFSFRTNLFNNLSDNLMSGEVGYSGFSDNFDITFSRANLSDRLVMLIKTNDINNSRYIRGLCYDYYTGYGWEISSEKRNEFNEFYLSRRRNYTRQIASPDDFNFNIEYLNTIKQNYTILIKQPNVLFGVYKIGVLSIHSRKLKIDDMDNIRIAGSLDPGTEYSIISYVKTIPPQELIALDSNSQSKLSALKRYTQLSPVPERLVKLTRDITKDIESDYGKVLALQEYLLTNYRYTLEINAIERDKIEDVTDYFIFEMAGGYCEQFATALTVMCRIEDIPARVVTGYAGGVYNWQTGRVEIRELNAHAWVEIYFEKYGWITFDPTPSGFYERKENSHIFAVMRRFFDRIFNIDPQILIPKTALKVSRTAFGNLKKFIKEYTWVIIISIIFIIASLLILKLKKRPRETFFQEGRDSNSITVIKEYYKIISIFEKKFSQNFQARTTLEIQNFFRSNYYSQLYDSGIFTIFNKARYSQEGINTEEMKIFLNDIELIEKIFKEKKD